MKTAIIAGATGLVGRSLLRLLLDDPRYGEVKVLSRRAPGFDHPNLKLLLTELNRIESLGDALKADDAYCCLGTTQRAAGSKAAFEAVDYHGVVDFARATRKAGARQFLVVSSLSASPRSTVYYSRIKGRMERAVQEIGFESVHVLRPSLLLGARDEQRPGEDLAQRIAPLISPLLRGPLKIYRPIKAQQVAAEMQRLAALEQPGAQVHTLVAGERSA